MSTLQDIQEYLERTKNPVQLVKHFDEVPDSKKKYPLIVQRKYDGVYCMLVVVDGTAVPYSRTGKELYLEDMRRQIHNTLHDGVYITELCNDIVSLEVLSGLVSPNRTSEWSDEQHSLMEGAYFMYHDYLTLDEFLSGRSDVPYRVRYASLYLKVASKYTENALVDNTNVYDMSEVENIFKYELLMGHEGIVIKDPEAGWVAGHKGYRAMKLVRGVSLDLLCTGVLYGKGKRAGLIAALEFEYKGSTFKADLGAGWTDEKRTALTNAYENQDMFSPENYPVGKIWEVKALQISSTGKALRLPKAVRVRFDKVEPDA